VSECEFLEIGESSYLNPRYIIKAKRDDFGFIVQVEGEETDRLLQGKTAERVEQYLLRHTPERMRPKRQPYWAGPTGTSLDMARR